MQNKKRTVKKNIINLQSNQRVRHFIERGAVGNLKFGVLFQKHAPLNSHPQASLEQRIA